MSVEQISFTSIRNLYKVQEKESFKLTNSLFQAYVNYYNKKMNVNSAVQTVSSGIVDALQFLQNKGQFQFKNCAATIRFIRVFDRIQEIVLMLPLSFDNMYLWELSF